MLFLNTARGWGKTKLLAEWVMEDPERILAVKNYHMRRNILNNFDINPKQVIDISSDSSSDGMNSLRGRRRNGVPIKIAVDEAEELIQYLLDQFFQGNRVDIVSMSARNVMSLDDADPSL